MIDFKLKGKKYKIPSKIEELTIRQYLDIIKTDSDSDLLSKLGGIPIEDIKTCNQKEVSFFIHQLSEMFNDIKDIDEKDMPLSFRINDSRYWICQDIANASWGRWEDCRKYMKQYADNIEEYFPYLLSIYSLKKEEKYDSSILNERVEQFKDLPYVLGLKMHAFFLTSNQEYLNVISLYLKEKRELKKSKQEATSSAKSTVQP